jgi:hypothetical protein
MVENNKDSDDSLRKIYMQPKSNAHVRIGNRYQASIPETKIFSNGNEEEISKTNKNMTEISNNEQHVSIDDEIGSLQPPIKRRRLDK